VNRKNIKNKRFVVFTVCYQMSQILPSFPGEEWGRRGETGSVIPGLMNLIYAFGDIL
jgi:hypothetical protein